MKLLFIDESGDHNLNLNKIDSQFPIFVLTGIIFEKSDYLIFKKNLGDFKKEIFGTKKVFLHSRELTRPNITKQKEIGSLTDKVKRRKFYDQLNILLSNTKFNVYSFCIDKVWFAKNFGEFPPDPYFLSFNYIFSLFQDNLSSREHGKIIVEHRNKILDKQFLLAWQNLRLNHPMRHISKPQLVEKSYKLAGIELVDLVSYKLSRIFLKKAEKGGNEIETSLLLAKKLTISGLPEISINKK